MLVLVIGDLFIPQMTIDLPLKFKKLLVPGKIQQILCTGNLTSPQTLDYLKTICPDITMVQGELDSPSIPLSKVVNIFQFKIGLVNGFSLVPSHDDRAKEMMARELDVDVLLYGYEDGFSAKEIDGRYYVNPGSATNVYSSVKVIFFLKIISLF